MGALLVFVALIAIYIAWVVWRTRNNHAKYEQKKQSLFGSGRAIQRELHGNGMDYTVFIIFKCADPDALLQKLKSPHYLSAANVVADNVSPSELLIMCVDEPKWTASLKVQSDGTGSCALIFMFDKWKGSNILVPAGTENECRTVIERTVLQIDPQAQFATRMNKLEGGMGLIGTAFHNAGIDDQGALKFTSLAAVYASAPPLQAATS